eukprot:3949504-Prymnesium_polylepis.1
MRSRAETEWSAPKSSRSGSRREKAPDAISGPRGKPRCAGWGTRCECAHVPVAARTLSAVGGARRTHPGQSAAASATQGR